MKLSYIFSLVLLFLCGCSSSTRIETQVSQSATLPVRQTVMPSIFPTFTETPWNTPTTRLVTETPTPTPERATPLPSPTATKATFPNRAALSEGNYLLYNTSTEIFDIRVISGDSFDDSFANQFLRVPVKMYFGEALSPDGKLFAYTSGDPYGSGSLNLLNLIDDSSKGSFAHCFAPTFAPDSQHLATICSDATSTLPPQIYIIDLLDGTQIQIPYSDRGSTVSLGWSPDGKNLAFAQYQGNGPQQDSRDFLYLMNTACLKDPKTCQNQVHLLAISAHYFFYSTRIIWSPDSQNILIQDGSNELKMVNVVNHGSNVTKFENVLSGYAWSPDNLSISFTRYWLPTGNNNRIWITPIQGGEKKAISVGSSTGPYDDAVLFDWIKLLDFKVGRSYTVTSLAKNLALRDKPSLDGKVIKSLQPKDTVTLVDGPVNADYCTWWKMKVGDVEGWAQGFKYWFDAAK